MGKLVFFIYLVQRDIGWSKRLVSRGSADLCILRNFVFFNQLDVSLNHSLSAYTELASCKRLFVVTIHSSASVHQTAIIDNGATVGAKTRVWHWVHICGDAFIGDCCSLGQNVFVGNKAIVGNNVKIQNNVSVYDNVTLEDDVFCGPSMVFTNVYNPRSAISRKNEYLPTHVERGATLGANCTIVCGIRIGRYSFIGAGAVVNRDVKPFALMVGVPAKQIGWISAFGERVDLPLVGHGMWICPHTGDAYKLDVDKLCYSKKVE